MLANGAYAAGSFSVMFGNKALDKDDWERVASHSELGFVAELQELELPMAFVVSYLVSGRKLYFSIDGLLYLHRKS